MNSLRIRCQLYLYNIKNMMGFINLDDKNYMPIIGFTTVDLGCERGNNAYNMVQKTGTPFATAYIASVK